MKLNVNSKNLTSAQGKWLRIWISMTKNLRISENLTEYEKILFTEKIFDWKNLIEHKNISDYGNIFIFIKNDIWENIVIEQVVKLFERNYELVIWDAIIFGQ
jgi:hypothetical protein